MARRVQRLRETSRVEGFSDAVFAISATLLVLDLGIPEEGNFLAGVLEDWPGLVAYVAAFLTIASIWLHHHNFFSRIRAIDAQVVAANLLLLFGVAIQPWPTALLAASLGGGNRQDEMVAITVYTLTSVVVSAAWLILAWSLTQRPDLLLAPSDLEWMRGNFRRVAASSGVVVLAVPLGFISPYLSLALFVAIPAAFLILSTRPTELVEDEGPAEKEKA